LIGGWGALRFPGCRRSVVDKVIAHHASDL